MDDNSDDLYTIGAEFIENLLQENVGVVSELKPEKKYINQETVLYIDSTVQIIQILSLA